MMEALIAFLRSNREGEDDDGGSHRVLRRNSEGEDEDGGYHHVSEKE